MTAKQLERIVNHKPFQPYRLVTVDGDEVTVTQPRKSHVSGDSVALHGKTVQSSGASREGLRLILAKNIVRAEFVEESVERKG